MLEVVGHQYWVCLLSQAFVTFSAYYLEQGKDVGHSAYIHYFEYCISGNDALFPVCIIFVFKMSTVGVNRLK